MKPTAISTPQHPPKADQPSAEAKDLFSVQGHVMIITGGLGQLGYQFSVALLERGARVAVFDVRADDRAVKERFGDWAANGQLLGLKIDVTRREAIEAGVREVLARWGAPQGLINNAALDAPPGAPLEETGPVERYPEASWDRVMDVNVKGAFLCSQVVGAKMAEAGHGSIINVCSIYGLVSPDQRIYASLGKEGTPFVKPVAYAVSKSALLNLTRYLATYWGPRHVRVNTITFGGVLNQQDPQWLPHYCDRVPLGRMAREEEYNGAVIFLLSEASSYMTGANLVMDGGWTAW